MLKVFCNFSVEFPICLDIQSALANKELENIFAIVGNGVTSFSSGIFSGTIVANEKHL